MKFLVIDCGTSGCRAAVISHKGKLLSQSKVPITVQRPAHGLAELDTNHLWSKVSAVIKKETQKHSPSSLCCMGVSTMLGWVFLNAKYQPLMPAIVYMDNRAKNEVKQLLKLISPEEVFARTGHRPSPLLLAPKLTWLAKYNRPLFLKIHKTIGLKDELVRRLTGAVQTDFAHLDYSMLYNVREAKLDHDLLDLLNIDSSILPTPRSPFSVAGYIHDSVATELNLPKGLPVITGSSDGTTAIYGGGGLDRKIAVLVSGSTDVLMSYSKVYPVDPNCVLTINTGAYPGTFTVGGPLGFSGATLRYLSQIFRKDAKKLQRLVASLDLNAPILLFLPGLGGERAPFWMEHVTGGLLGLTLEHHPEHIYRAAMEGCALRLKKILMIMEQVGIRPRVLNVVGGGAKSDVWNQIRANVTGLEVRKLNVTEATSIGTAMFCYQALAKEGSLEEISLAWIKIKGRYRPEKKKVAYYGEMMSLFEQYLQRCAPLFESVERLRGQSPT